MKRLVLIDGHAVLFRAFYAFPPLSTASGELVNAVFGFSLILLNVIAELEPTHIAVSFDLGEPTFRHEAFAAYKAQRKETPKDLIGQEGRVRQVVEALNIPIYEQAGFEADDVIGTIARQASQLSTANDESLDVVIVTGDMDALQLVSDGKVRVYVPGRGKKPALMYDEAAVGERYGGLTPVQVIDYKGLAGDTSDNIPGVKGIGPKTAIELLLQFGSVEELYARIDRGEIGGISKGVLAKLSVSKEMAFQSKDLATIRTNAPVRLDLAACALQEYDKQKVIGLFEELEFRSLIGRLPNDQFEQDVQEVLF